jgi:hypothetical protein
MDGAGGLVDGGGEQGEGGPGGRGRGRSGGAVEADDGVEVDNPATLVFGDLGVGDPELGGECLIGEPGQTGKGSPEGDGEAAPQVGGAGVEQDRASVVIAVRAQRLAKPGVVRAVLLGAGHPAAVWAGLGLASGLTSQGSAVFIAARVDGAEGGRGERGKHAWMAGHGGGDALAAGQPGADQLVGIGAVDLGAGRTAGGAAGLAGDGQDPAGLVSSGVAVDQFAGGAVDVIDAATQQNRLQAAARAAGGGCTSRDRGQERCSSRQALAGGMDERRQPHARRGSLGFADQRCSAASSLARLPAAQARSCGYRHRDRAPGDSPARRSTVIPRWGGSV